MGGRSSRCTRCGGWTMARRSSRSRRTSLIVGSSRQAGSPALTAEGGSAAARRVGPRPRHTWPGRLVREPQPAGALHHARPARGQRCPALQQQPPDRADARLRGDVHGDDSRRARSCRWTGGPHSSPSLRSWMGDSRGRWEGDTLVIGTTNFTDRTNFRGSGASLAPGRAAHARIDADTIDYRFTRRRSDDLDAAVDGVMPRS